MLKSPGKLGLHRQGSSGSSGGSLPGGVRPQPLAGPGWLVALALLAGGACSARAAPGPEELPSDILVADRKIGPFFVKPSFTIDQVGIDNNVFLSPTDPQSDFTATFTPGLRLALPFGANLFRIDGQVSYVYYQDFDSERSWNYAVGGTLEAVAGSFRIELHDRFQWTRERYNYEVTERARRFDNLIGGRLTSDRESGLYLEGYGEIDTIRFDDDPEGGNPDIAAALDRDELNAGLAGFLELLGPARLVAGGEIVRQRFQSSDAQRDTDGYFLYSGLRFEPGQSLTGEIDLGYRTSDVEREGHPDFSGFGLRADIKAELAESITLGVAAGRGPEASLDEFNLYSVNTWARPYALVPLGDRVQVDLSLESRRTSYPLETPLPGGARGPKREDDVLYMDGGFSVGLWGNVSVRFGASKRRLESNYPGVGYDGVVYGMGLRYGV